MSTEQLLFLDVDGSTMGPLTLEQVRTLYESGENKAETLYAFKDAQEWLPLATILPLLNAAPAVVPPPVLPPVMAQAKPQARAGDAICLDCHAVGRAHTEQPGSVVVAILLLLLFCLPSVIYMAWALTASERRMCATCGGSRIIPVETDKARELVDVQPATRIPVWLVMTIVLAVVVVVGVMLRSCTP
jgi:hypothetical protein